VCKRLPVARASKATLQQLEPFLHDVRDVGIDGLVEKANGAFYKGRVGILHFHEDADGVYADVKVDGEWQRVRVDRGHGRRTVLGLLRKQYGAVTH
jgi:hypothetical protein